MLLLLLTFCCCWLFLLLLAFQFVLTFVLLLASLFLLVSAVVSIYVVASVHDFPYCSRCLWGCCRQRCCWCFFEPLLYLGGPCSYWRLCHWCHPFCCWHIFLFLVFPPWFLAFLFRCCPIAGVPAFAGVPDVVGVSLVVGALLLYKAIPELPASPFFSYFLTVAGSLLSIDMVFLKVYKYEFRGRFCNF